MDVADDPLPLSRAPSESVHLSVVVPAFNEVENLARVIDETTVCLDHAAVGAYQIIIVDDGSTDGTGAAADALAHRYVQVEAVHHDRNRGFGAAIRSGYAAATGEYVTQIPADGEITIGEALGLLSAIGSHDVIASRREREPSMGRDALTGVFHLAMRALLGFSGNGLDGIFVIRGVQLKQLPLVSSTGLINLETLMRCSRRGLTITHGVVRVSPRLSGRSKVTNGATMRRMLLELLKLRIAMASERK